MPLTMRFKRLPHAADMPAPKYMTEHAAGMDLYAACNEPITINPGEIKTVPTGLVIEIPPGFEGQIRARSGLALKHGLMLPNSPGTIDADYRGELMVILGNVSREPYSITRGMRFAQLIICKVERVAVEEVADLSDTSRASGGFGHTGTR